MVKVPNARQSHLPAPRQVWGDGLPGMGGPEEFELQEQENATDSTVNAAEANIQEVRPPWSDYVSLYQLCSRIVVAGRALGVGGC